MSSDHSTSKPARNKPAKPYPEFPLFPHATGYWAKKIRGTTHYFGPWEDPDAALTKYLEEKDALHAGKKPRAAQEATTIWDLVNRFLTFKQERVDSGELSQRTWDEYKEACDLIVSHFKKRRLLIDLTPGEFERLRAKMASKWGPHRLSKMIQCIRSVFKYAVDVELTLKQWGKGPGFEKPHKKVLRVRRAEKGRRMFEAAELRRVLEAAGLPMRAMILLGVNCGFGNADCGTLPRSALDLEGGWVDYHRPKTGIHRRCSLWPETVEAIRAALEKRPEPKLGEHANLVFITKYKGPWHKHDSSDTPISNEMRKLLNSLEIIGNRNFYALRHTFETIGGESRDQPAVDLIMGHARDDMASVYRERISDERLKAVTDHVYQWLFPSPKDSSKPDQPQQDEAGRRIGQTETAG